MSKRILYLHGMKSTPRSAKLKVLTDIYGERAVRCPNLGTKEIVVSSVLFLLFVCVALVAVVAVLFCYAETWAAVLSIPITLLLAYVVVAWGGRGICGAMLRRATRIAEDTTREFRPNVIVASSFGAVVALSMTTPKCPMLLLTPAHGVFNRYMRNTRNIYSVASYPYVIVVHPSNDKVVPLDDSIQLVESSHLGRTRLEVLEDTHVLKTLTSADIREFVDEIYTRGKMEVLTRGEDYKDSDPSLFDEIDTGDDKNDPTEKLLPSV